MLYALHLLFIIRTCSLFSEPKIPTHFRAEQPIPSVKHYAHFHMKADLHLNKFKTTNFQS